MDRHGDLQMKIEARRRLTSIYSVVLAKVNFNTARQMPKPSEHDQPIQESTRVRTRLTPKLRKQIVEHYQLGTFSALETAEHFGVGKSTVLRILRDAGAEVRPQGRRLT